MQYFPIVPYFRVRFREIDSRIDENIPRHNNARNYIWNIFDRCSQSPTIGQSLCPKRPSHFASSMSASVCWYAKPLPLMRVSFRPKRTSIIHNIHNTSSGCKGDTSGSYRSWCRGWSDVATACALPPTTTSCWVNVIILFDEWTYSHTYVWDVTNTQR